MANEWYCDHCGVYFPAVSEADVCPCGAPVDPDYGMARFPDRHRWMMGARGSCAACPPTSDELRENSAIPSEAEA